MQKLAKIVVDEGLQGVPMENNAPKPTLILKIGGKKIKEYTRGRVILKLKQGVLSPETLVHNPDGLWRKVCETPGFRSLCAQILGGNDKPGQMPLIRPGNESEGSKTILSSPEIACLKSEESIAFSIKLDGEDTLSREEFVIESADDDSSGDLASPGAAGGQAELGLDDSRELPVGKDSVAAAVAAMDFSGENSSYSPPLPDRSDSVNPYAVRPYFRVKSRPSKPEIELGDDDNSQTWKKRIVAGVLTAWVLLVSYWYIPNIFNNGNNLEIPTVLSEEGTELKVGADQASTANINGRPLEIPKEVGPSLADVQKNPEKAKQKLKELEKTKTFGH